MKLFARITKINEADRTVCGTIADETKDLSGEIFDYTTSVPFFKEWSDSIHKATGGKSVGNVRVMHGNTVAGVTKEIGFNDLAKEITVTAKVVDDNEWKKTLEGCYTGFSIGGAYKGKWDTPEGKRYTAAPSEYSLVDIPCNPGATFKVAKADGTEELRKFAPVVHTVEEVIEETLATAQVKLSKGLWNAARLAELLQELSWVKDDAAWEAECERDGSSIPRELRDIVVQLGNVLVRMTQEEVGELTASDAVLALSAKAALQKYQQSKEDAMSDELKKAHDAAVAALATANTDLAKKAEELAKVAGERDELKKALDKAAADIAERDEMMTKASAALADRDALIAKFEALPQPLKAAITAVAKSADVTGGAPEVTPVMEDDGVTVNKAATEIKKALLNPVYNS